MTRQDVGTPTTVPIGGWGEFWRHYAEMVAAMVVGMMVLGMAVRLILGLLGRSELLDPIEVRALLMATNMTIGMVVLMRWRGHGWAAVAEMGAVMYLSFALLLFPFWAGVLSEQAVMMGGHLLMLPLMLLAMLRRRGEYLHRHPRHTTPDLPAPSVGTSGGAG